MMSDNARIVELEIKLAYQDDLLEQLSDTLIYQKREIDGLKLQLERLDARLTLLATENATEQEIPPHY